MNALLTSALSILLLSASEELSDKTWGFWSHKFINRMAVYRLPSEMSQLFKKNIELISGNAVNPDRRRYSVPGEAEKHYIDLDVYGDSAAFLPRSWADAIQKFGEDSLRKHGIAPWYLQQHIHRLTEAFRSRNPPLILRLATDLGHYIADIHVPLHTTRNYNGQFTGQEGIHAFWETRLPELYAGEYDLWIGSVNYIDNTTDVIWETIYQTHAACDSVLRFEKKAMTMIPTDRRYVYEARNSVLVKVPSAELSDIYHRMLAGQVERQMKAAIRLIGDLWYTCWINAGQPSFDMVQTPEYIEDTTESPPRTLRGIRIEAEY